MKKMTKFAAFLAATTMTLSPTMAYADEGDKASIYWNPAAEELSGILMGGGTVCDGSSYQNACYTFFRVTQELNVHYTSRQRKGVGTNFGTVRLIRSTADGAVMTDETGNIISTMSKTAVVENGDARLYQVLSSVFNGFGASIAGPLTCSIAGCNNGGSGGGSVAYAISGSEALANALSGAEVTVQGALPAGVCVTCDPTH